MLAIFNSLLPVLSLIISIGIAFGGIMAYRNGYGKQAAEIEARVISAYKAEVSVMRSKIEDLENDNERNDRMLNTIRYLLKQYGITIIINGDYVTLRDNSGQSKVTRIRPNKPAPKPKEDDEDEDAS